jgi:hypothetical protein
MTPNRLTSAFEQEPTPKLELQPGSIRDELYLGTIHAALQIQDGKDKSLVRQTIQYLEADKLADAWLLLQGNENTRFVLRDPVIESIVETAYEFRTGKLQPEAELQAIRGNKREKLFAKISRLAFAGAESEVPSEDEVEVDSNSAPRKVDWYTIHEGYPEGQLSDDVRSAIQTFEAAEDSLYLAKTELNRLMNDFNYGDRSSAFNSSTVRDLIYQTYQKDSEAAIVSAKNGVIDTVFSELSEPYKTTGEGEVVMNQDNFAALALAYSLASDRLYEDSRYAFRTAGKIAVIFDKLLNENPMGLVHSRQKDGLAQLRDKGITFKATAAQMRQNVTLNATLQYGYFAEDRFIFGSEPIGDPMYEDGGSLSSKLSHCEELCLPVTDPSKYVDDYEDLDIYFERITHFINGRLDLLPRLEHYATVRIEERIAEQVRAYSSYSWGQAVLPQTVDSLLIGGPKTTGTYETRIDPDVKAEMQEMMHKVVELSTKSVQLNNPEAVRTEMLSAGIDEEKLVGIVRTRLNDMSRGNAYAQVPAIVSTYSSMMAHFINSIFGGNVQAEDIAKSS